MDNQERTPYIQIQPTLASADWVKCFWSARRMFTADRPLFEILPDSYAELVFSYGSECSLISAGRSVILPNPFIIGLLDGPLYLHAQGTLQVFGIRLYPWALSVVAEAYGCGEYSSWIPGLRAGIDHGDAGETLNSLRTMFEAKLPVSPKSALRRAATLFLNRKGRIAPADLAAHANTSLRTLQRMFRRDCGESPKSISRRMRFEQVRDWIWKDPDVYLTGLAYECGYTDQAHLNREFRHFSRRTPGQFAHECRISKAFLEEKSVVFIQVSGS